MRIVQRTRRIARVASAASLLCAAALATAAPPERVSRAQLPADFVVGAATEPLRLPLAAVQGAGADASLVATPDAGADSTILAIKSSAAANIKVDLYISPDGERFYYTSSCAVLAGKMGMEHWPHAIHSFAIGRPRVVADDAMTCD